MKRRMSFTDVNVGGGGRRGGGEPPSASAGGSGSETAAILEEAEAMAFQLTTRVATYKRMVSLLGTKKDTQTHRENLRGVSEDVSSLAKRAAHRLRGCKPKGKRSKARQAKLSRDIQTVLADFQKSQRLCAEKRTLSAPVTTPAKKSRGSRRSRAGRASDAAADDSEPLLLQQHQQQSQQAQEQIAIEGELEHNNAVLEEREEDIREIQHQIGEVTEIFQDLAVLVSEQGELVDDVEANIVSTYDKTEQANAELKKAARHQKSARMQLCSVAFVIIVGVLVLMMVLGIFKTK